MLWIIKKLIFVSDIYIYMCFYILYIPNLLNAWLCFYKFFGAHIWNANGKCEQTCKGKSICNLAAGALYDSIKYLTQLIMESETRNQ